MPDENDDDYVITRHSPPSLVSEAVRKPYLDWTVEGALWYTIEQIEAERREARG